MFQKKKFQKKFYSTKFEPPKKEVKEKKLSENIQKFLAKKEIEEREQKMMADQKRLELLAKRDTKAKNKINKMLKVIKSANKSVLDDAVDNADTAVTLQGPDQPDEDDYGYVSQEASHFYKNLMDKYKTQPEDKIKGLKGQKALSKDEMRNMKARVTAAINREKEEENQPHRRQRQPKSHGSSTETTKTADSSSKYAKYDKYPGPGPSEEKPKPKPKPKRPPAPIMDFNQLLKLAEQKQFEPIEVTVPTVKKGPERLMTEKEKIEYEERRAFTEAKDKRHKLGEKGITKPIGKPIDSHQIKNGGNGRIPKLSQSGQSKSTSSKSVPDRTKFSSTSREILESKNKLKTILSANDRDKGRDNPQKKAPSASSSKLPPNQSTNSNKGRQFPPADVKTKTLPPANGKARQFPPADVKTRQFPPSDVRSREFPPQDLKRGKPLTSKNIQSKKSNFFCLNFFMK